jgi:hypothetical protein
VSKKISQLATRNSQLWFVALVAGAVAFCVPGAAHTLKRATARAEMWIGELRGQPARLVSVRGTTGIAGAQVVALDSPSGWASLCDSEGRFVLPDVRWYPGAELDLIVTSDGKRGWAVRLGMPGLGPSDRTIDFGLLPMESASEVDLSATPGVTSTSYERYDVANDDYYRRLFQELTAGLGTDEEKVAAVNDYVFEKLNYDQTQWELGTPRRVLEGGSQFCGHLSAAMATILSLEYETRIIHLSDGATPPNTHAVVEVYYGGGWHLYDPTFGTTFPDRQGRVASYRTLRLDPDLVAPARFERFRRRYPNVSTSTLRGEYASGFHHVYEVAFEREQPGHAWWTYENDLGYVPRGGRVVLAAAGVRPGTAVTYRVRRPGERADLQAFTTRGVALASSVLNQEMSPPIELEAGRYEVLVDFEDGNGPDGRVIRGWRLGIPLVVR